MDLEKAFQTLRLSCCNFTMMHGRKLPPRHTHFLYKECFHRQFYFPRSWTQTDFKSPITIFQSFNLAEYVFHKNCREGRQFIKLMFDQTCFIWLPIALILRCNKMNSRTCGAICFWVLKTCMLTTDKKKVISKKITSMLHKCGCRENLIYEKKAIKSYFYCKDYTIKIKLKVVFLICKWLPVSFWTWGSMGMPLNL